MAFVVALLATVGSLYFSEVAHFEPCLLCWYQRIAMYPLVVILGLAAWRDDVGAWIYATALAAIGAVIAAITSCSSGFRRCPAARAIRTTRARSCGSACSASSACRRWP